MESWASLGKTRTDDGVEIVGGKLGNDVSDGGVGFLQGGLEKEEFVGSDKACGHNDGNDGLVDGGESAIPIPLFVIEGLRKRLEPSHAGHFLDAVDEESGTRTAQDEHQRGVRCREAEVDSAVDNVE